MGEKDKKTALYRSFKRMRRVPPLQDLSMRTASERLRDGEGVGGDHRCGVQLHRPDVRGAVGRISAVHDEYDRREVRPVFLRGTERGHVEGDVEGADAEVPDVALQQGADRAAKRSVSGIAADHDQLLLLDGGEARKRADAFQRDVQAERSVDTGEIPEVVGAMFSLVGRGVAAEAFDLRVVGATGCRDLCVAVDDGAAGPPEAVPHQEGVARLRVGLEGLATPLKADGDVASDLLGREVEGVVVVEDDDAVEAIVLGDVRGRGRMLALHAAEHVRRGAAFRVAERIAFRRGYLAVEVQADAGVERTGGAQPIEERAFERDTVRYLHDALGGDVVHRAEGFLDPGVHRLRRMEASRRRGDVEDALREGAILVRELGDEGPKVSYPTFDRHGLDGTLSGGLEAGVEALAVDHAFYVPRDPQFQARDLVGEADGLGPVLAVEAGHEQRRPEGVAGARGVLDLHLGQRSHVLHAAVVRDGDAAARTGEDNDLRTEVVELC